MAPRAPHPPPPPTPPTPPPAPACRARGPARVLPARRGAGGGGGGGGPAPPPPPPPRRDQAPLTIVEMCMVGVEVEAQVWVANEK